MCGEPFHKVMFWCLYVMFRQSFLGSNRLVKVDLLVCWVILLVFFFLMFSVEFKNPLAAQGSSVASPICQEGKSERTFPVFASSCPFFFFFPLFHDFFLIFSNFLPLFLLIFGQFFCVHGHSASPLPLCWLHHWSRGRFGLKPIGNCGCVCVCLKSALFELFWNFSAT